MKKIVLSLVLAVCMSSTVFAEDYVDRNKSWAEAIALYLPNRVLDALDAFSVTMGVGPVAEARVMLTRAFGFGAGIGMNYMLSKGYARQYGVGSEQFWYWNFACFGEESYSMDDGSALIKKYQEDHYGIPDMESRTYDFFEGPRDYWAIGGAIGCGLDFSVYVHPVEWVDFFLGLFFIDMRNDDLVFDDFR